MEIRPQQEVQTYEVQRALRALKQEGATPEMIRNYIAMSRGAVPRETVDLRQIQSQLDILMVTSDALRIQVSNRYFPSQ